MSLPRLSVERCVLLVVDVQEKLVPVMSDGDRVVGQCAKLIAGCAALGVPIVATEQAPEKLGPTVEPIRNILPPDTPIDPKVRFSAFIEPVRHRLSRIGRPIVIVCGIEAHVCVLQTALDLVGSGYVSAVAQDAIDSRRVSDREAAISRMNASGILPLSVEMALLEMTHEAGTDRFRSILPMIR